MTTTVQSLAFVGSPPSEMRDNVRARMAEPSSERLSERPAGQAGEHAAVRPSEPDGLIARAATGDRLAFRAVYERHRSDVARLVYRMLGARSDLEDVIQEVFFQVFKSLKDFRGQSKFSTWLHRVTVNVVLMHRRAARSRPVYAEETAHDITADEENVPPDEDADRRERVRAFGRLLNRLADKKRIVFVLHELEGVAPSEIAKIVGCPVLTVRTRLFYARRELETLLAEEPSLAQLRATFSKVHSDAPSETRDGAMSPALAMPNPGSAADGRGRGGADR